MLFNDFCNFDCSKIFNSRYLVMRNVFDYRFNLIIIIKYGQINNTLWAIDSLYSKAATELFKSGIPYRK